MPKNFTTTATDSVPYVENAKSGEYAAWHDDKEYMDTAKKAQVQQSQRSMGIAGDTESAHQAAKDARRAKTAAKYKGVGK